MTDRIPVSLDKPRGPFKPCRWCGYASGTVLGEPSGFHAAIVRCGQCLRGIAWLSARQFRRVIREAA